MESSLWRKKSFLPMFGRRINQVQWIKRRLQKIVYLSFTISLTPPPPTPTPRRSMHVWNMHLYSCSWGKSNDWKVYRCANEQWDSQTDRQTYRQTKSTGDHKRSLECNWAVKFKRCAYMIIWAKAKHACTCMSPLRTRLIKLCLQTLIPSKKNLT